jgi:protein-S-isoprenylcysteine O-methyltransferase Ste14
VKAKRPFTVKRWLKSTSKRTFILYPVLVFALECLIHKGLPDLFYWGLPLLPWGYLQYRLGGNYRTRHGGGGPGVDIPPDRIVDTGIYAWTRNPMYLGHLIFMTGLATSLLSIPALALLIFHFYWFHQRVLEDEQRLLERFGPAYSDYMQRVKRWLPGII